MDHKKDICDSVEKALEASELSVKDLLCNMMFYCKVNNLNFNDCLAYAENHFRAEYDERSYNHKCLR